MEESIAHINIIPQNNNKINVIESEIIKKFRSHYARESFCKENNRIIYLIILDLYYQK